MSLKRKGVLCGIVLVIAIVMSLILASCSAKPMKVTKDAMSVTNSSTTDPSAFTFTPISGTLNCTVKLTNKSLERIVVPRTAEIAGVEYTVTEVALNGFSSTPGLKAVTLPTTIKKIGNTAFQNCADLELIYFPEVMEIGMNAFSLCPSLTDIIFPITVQTVGATILRNNNTTVHARAASKPAGWVSNWNGSNANSTVDFASEFMFDLQTEDRVIPTLARSIVIERFLVAGQPFSERLNDPNAIVITSDIDNIEDGAFLECKFSTFEVEAASKPINVESYAFQYCIGDSVIFNREITFNCPSNGQSCYVFVGCIIPTIVLPNTIETIVEGMFYGCYDYGTHTGLRNIGFLDLATDLVEFGGDGIIVFPASVQEIKDYAFADTLSIDSLHIPADVAVGDAIISNWISTQYIHVPFATMLDTPLDWGDWYGYSNATIVYGVIIEYTVEYNSNIPIGASGVIVGSTANSSHIYNSSAVLTANGYSLTGWRFNGWNTVANGSGTNYVDGETIINLSSIDSDIVTLYAQWIPNAYTVAYNANKPSGASAQVLGAMDTTSHTYDTVSALRVNAFQLEGWAFAGWNTVSNGGGTIYSDTANVSVLTSAHNGTVTLYAQWTANTYTVVYHNNRPNDASGAVSGTMNNSTHTYDTPSALRSNAYALDGWAFAGWNTVADGSGVAYLNNANVSTLNSTNNGSTTLFAQWAKNSYTVSYDANRPANASNAVQGTMTDTTHTYDVASPLRSNTFALIGWRFMGWNTVADGSGTAYANNASVSTLNTANSGTTVLYAQWLANVYYIQYNSNKPSTASGTIVGMMNDSTFSYDTASPLRANSFSLTGWRFIGWNTDADGNGTAFSNGASLSTQTFTNAATIVLFAQWIPNDYTVSYNANKPSGASGTVGGTMSDTAHVYDTSSALRTNAFSLTGWRFIAWNTEANGSGIVFYDATTVRTLNFAHNGTTVLYAQWAVNTYNVSYNANKPATASGNISGAMAETAHTYDTASNLRANAYALIGWCFNGWNTAANGSGTPFADSASVSTLNTAQNGTTTLYAQWLANNYSVSYNGNKPSGASGSICGATANSNHTFDTASALTSNGFTLIGWTFVGWNTMQNGSGTAFIGGASVSTLNSTHNGTTILYAQWTQNSYTVTYEKNKPTTASSQVGGAMSDSSHIYDTASFLRANAYTLTGWRLSGWSLSESGSVVYADGASISTLNSENGENTKLYAKWINNDYTVVYDKNVPVSASNMVSGTMANTAHVYDVASQLRQNAYILTGWSVTHWNTAANGSGTSYADKAIISTLNPVHNGTTTLYAQWAQNPYTVAYEKNKPTTASSEVVGTMTDSSHIYDAASSLRANVYTLTGWRFIGWSLSASGSVVYTDGASISTLNSGNGGNTKLYAKWINNDYTVIYDKNKPATASSAVNGTMANTAHVYDIASPLRQNAYTLIGWKFIGWSTSASGNVVYSDKDNISIGTATNTGTATLFAKWTQTTYTVTYEKNKPSTASSQVGGTMAASSHIYDAASPLRTNAYTLTGWRFNGWSTSATGSVVYSEGASISISHCNDNENTKLFAQWVANTYTVVLDRQSGTGGVTSVTATYDSDMPSAAAPTKTGYTFGGYFTNTNGGGTQYYNANSPMGSVNKWTSTTNNTTLYAKWTIITYTITYQLSGTATNPSSNPTSYTVETPSFSVERPGGSPKTGYYYVWAQNTSIPKGSTGNKTFTVSSMAIYYSITWYFMELNSTASTSPVPNPDDCYKGLRYDTQVTIYKNVQYQDSKYYIYAKRESDGAEWQVTNSNSVVLQNLTTIDYDTVDLYLMTKSCVAEGTLITLADGSQKAVELLTMDDLLLVWNLHTGSFDAAPILFIDSDEALNYEIIHLYFSDGTEVKVITEHAFWDVDLKKYIFLRNDAAQYLGHWFNKQIFDSNNEMTWAAVQLVDVQIHDEYTTSWSPVTFGHLCYYVNGMLSMPGATEGLINIFEVDAVTMQYDMAAFIEDIETYGLLTYDDVAEIMPELVFEAFGGQFLLVSMGKGLTTWEEIFALLERYAPFFENL